MSVPEPYYSRLNSVRRILVEQKLDALLVNRPENRRYLSGYKARDPQLDESSGCLLITRYDQILFTDFRYRLQAEQEAAGYQTALYQGGIWRILDDWLEKLEVRKLGFEEEFTTVKAHRTMRENTAADLIPTSLAVESLRIHKDETEVEHITQALRLTEQAVVRTIDYIKAGIREIEAARYLEAVMLELGAESPAFETIVASGPNAALPHAVPGPRRIQEGETIIIDCGAQLDGYKSDMTRTVVLGPTEPWIKEIYNLVRRAQLIAINGLKAGLMTDQADSLARDVIREAGYGDFFGHGLGHGVGLATHEAPSLSRLNPTRLQSGMVITVEPGIYLEGRGGVRLEEMVLITDDGARLLNEDRTFYDWP